MCYRRRSYQQQQPEQTPVAQDWMAHHEHRDWDRAAQSQSQFQSPTHPLIPSQPQPMSTPNVPATGTYSTLLSAIILHRQLDVELSNVAQKLQGTLVDAVRVAQMPSLPSWQPRENEWIGTQRQQHQQQHQQQPSPPVRSIEQAMPPRQILGWDGMAVRKRMEMEMAQRREMAAQAGRGSNGWFWRS